MDAAGERLRILHTESSLGWGGQEIRILSEGAAIARAGHEVVLAAPPQSRIFMEAAGYGIEAVPLPIAHKRPRAVFAMRRFLASRAFDIANTHSSTDSWIVTLACFGARRAPAIVRTRHISSAIPRNPATRWLFARAALTVTTGERLRRQVVEEARLDPATVVSIPTGIDLERFRPGDRTAARQATGLPVEAAIIGIVATLRSWKGHAFLIEALASLPEVMLVIVGDGPQRAPLEELARTLGIEKRVVFAGNRHDVAPWLRSFDVFCLPSYANEGVPQALMQAMACGVPVITTSVGAIDEIVTAGETGVIVPPRDAGALREALAALLEDGKRRRELGQRALAMARERFGDGRMTESMLAAFRSARDRHNKMAA